MKYMLLIHTPLGGEELAPDECAGDSRFDDYRDAVEGRTVAMAGARLHPASDATYVRAHDGEVLLSDGPFAEAKEYLAGFGLVEAADLDEAIELAARHPAASGGGTVEVRPVWE